LKRWLLVGLLATSSAFAQNATVTANVKTLAGAGAQPTGSSVRVDLQNCATPRVPGTGNLVSKSQTFYPNGSGVVTITLFSNSVIDCGSGVPATPVSFYTFNLTSNGGVTSLGSYKVPAGASTLDTLTPLNTTPVINTPSGDTTYLRLDLSNFSNLVQPVPFWEVSGPVTAGSVTSGSITGTTITGGSITSTGPIVGQTVNGVVIAGTFASLNAASAACSGACTIEVNKAVPLSASLVLPATTTLKFNQPGVITKSGFNLTVNGPLVAGAYTIFSGAGTVTLGSQIPLAPVEWFGATIGGGDDTAAIQACFNALTKGQCQLQTGSYNVSSALSITHSGVGLIGVLSSLPSPTLYPTPSPSQIVSSSATADILDVTGTSNSNAIAFNRFQDFTLARSVAPSGATARGLSLSFVDGPYVDGVTSEDSLTDFFIHGMASQGEGVIKRSVALWGANGITETTGGSMGGFVLDSSGGVTNNSARFEQDGTFSALPHSASAAYTTFGFSLQGDQTHDAFVDKFESATTDFGVLISQNVGSGLSASTDIHFTNMINDSCFVTCLKVAGILGDVEIAGGWEANSVNGVNAPVVEIDNSTRVSLNHVQIFDVLGNAGTPAVKVDSSLLTRIENSDINVVFSSAVDGASLTNDVGGVFSGNTIFMGGVGSTNGITISAATHGMVVGHNSVEGNATNGIIVASGSNGITGLDTNTIGATDFGTITNFLVNNGSNPLVLWAPGAPTGSCNNPGELWMNSSTTTGTFPDYQCKGTTWVGIGTAY